MRKLLLFFVVCFLCLTVAFGQNLNFAYHSYQDISGEIVSINSRSFYLENTYFGYHDSLNLVCVDKFGKVLFKKRFKDGEVHPVRRLRITKDKCVALAWSGTGCDYTPSNVNNHFVKIDTNGNEIFNTILSASSGDYVYDHVQGADSTYYLFSNVKKFRCSKTGSLVSNGGTWFTNISATSFLNNGNLLLSCKSNGTLSLVITNTNAITITEQTVSNKFVKMEQASNGKVYALTNNNTIESYSLDLNQLNNSLSTLSQIKEIKDFIIRNDSIFFTGYDSLTKRPFYGILDQNLSVLHFNQANLPNVTPTGISLTSENKVRIITSGSSSGFGFTGFYQMPINGGFISNDDIGVSNLSVQGSTVFLAGGWSLYWVRSDLNVTVKNFTTDTVKSFYLNSFAGYMGVICKFEWFHKLYNTKILPNDSIVVSVSSVTTAVSLPTVSGAPVIVNHCVFTTVPNSSVDKYNQNDSKCSTFTIGIQEIVETLTKSSNINLFPNPTSSKITIECEIEMKNIVLTDVMGRGVEAIIPERKKTELDLSKLKEGVYFVRIETEKGNVVRKIIKD